MLAFLQFDAASQPLVERMLAEGRLPALQALKNRGRWLPLEAESDFFEAAAYATLYAGTEVGEHGLYYGFVWSPAEHRVHYLDFNGVPETVWERLGRAGRRSLILDPYVPWHATAPGLSLSGWQFTHKIIPRWSSPRTAYRQFARRFGRTSLLQDVSGRRHRALVFNMRDVLLAGPARAANLVIDALGRDAFDFLWVNFISAHLTGHLFWDPSRIQAADLSDVDRKGLEFTLERVYEATDDALGRIVAALPRDADVLVFSPLGMGPETSRSDLLPGMLSAILAEGPSRAADMTDRVAGRSIWRFRARVPTDWRAAVARLLPGSLVRKIVAGLYLRGVDWSRTQAVVLPGDHYGYVRLNLRGRERHGIVSPADADALMYRIAAGLTSFADPDGTPAIASVERVKDHMVGARAGALPDLVVRWSERPSHAIAGVSSPLFGEVRREGVGTGRLGNHVPGSWLLIAPGASHIREMARRPRLVDLAATACDRLGAPSDGLQGESLLRS